MKDDFRESKYGKYAIFTLVAVIIVNLFLVAYLYFVEIYNMLVIVMIGIINCVLMLLVSFLLNHKKQEHDSKIEELAYRDFETNIYNFNYLSDNYKTIVRNIGINKCCYISIDIDNFKYVNNLMGYEIGSGIIHIMADVMKNSISEKELVIRFSGDIFGIIMAEHHTDDIVFRVGKIFENIKKEISNKYTDRANINFSCGVYVISSKEDDVKQVIDKSNIARKAAKTTYNKNIVFFDEKMQEAIKTRMEIEEDMEEAMKNKDFLIYLQPKVNMVTGKLYGAEALVRWQHKTKGFLMPGAFISAFEENGFILALDYYMFEEVCILRRKWHDIGKNYPIISVNMSRLHIYDKNFIYNLLEIAKKYDISPQELEIEVTENAFFEDSQMLLAFTDDLKRAGFKVSIDDFGSGFSSLNMLKDINADVLKIDRNFLISMDKNGGKGKKILKNVIAMARDLKIDIVTEGVETLSQIELLTNYGCEVAQGFYYARPMPVEEYEIFAGVHGEFVETACLYRFDGDMIDEYDGEEAKLIGSGFEFVDGLYEGRKALFMPGGKVSENYVQIPAMYLKE